MHCLSVTQTIVSLLCQICKIKAVVLHIVVAQSTLISTMNEIIIGTVYDSNVH